MIFSANPRLTAYSKAVRTMRSDPSREIGLMEMAANNFGPASSYLQQALKELAQR